MRAKTARHLAALANHGGGSLLIGVRDDRSYATSHPGPISSFTSDAFTGIIDRYLAPAFQCEVFISPPSSGGISCAVVRVPSHGSVPICAKANGPEKSPNVFHGVREGEYYMPRSRTEKHSDTDPRTMEGSDTPVRTERA